MHYTTIGIIGGMGPEATNRLSQLITQFTPAEKDQDHIPVITYNNSSIPDRTEFIIRNGENPLPELVKTARVLEAAGASFMLIPCNTSHFFLPELSRMIQTPILDMVRESINHISITNPSIKRIGIMATDGTLATNLYKKVGRDYGIEIIYPNEEDQQRVMNAIYEIKANKANNREQITQSLGEISHNLFAMGAQSIIAGCTEISLMLPQNIETSKYIDPLKIVARRAVEIALKNELILA